ncbi:MAG: LamG domain-containing protein [Anaerolineales bacterium]|nr:LamG domain-containing protein [Anaerolineales bacterium]
MSAGTLNVGGPNNGPQWAASDAPLSQDRQTASPAPATDSGLTVPPVVEAAPSVSEAALSAVTAGYALRFFGTGSDDIDRVKIPVDDPATGEAGPPADVGFTDFTLEGWLRAELSENPAPSVECGPDNVNWINGNIIFDRDRHSQGRKYGVSLAGGQLVFGVSGAEGVGDYTLCGTSTVADGQWHHIAVQRRRTDGALWLFVDGQLEAEGTGPGGDISYPDDGLPGDFCEGPCTNSDPFLVIGAEKHDAGAAYPSFSGFIDEVRLSNNLRYNDSFTHPMHHLSRMPIQ